MNEILIKEIVQRIMSDPDLLQQIVAHQPVVNETEKTEILILLNYTPNLAAILEKLAVEWGKDYRVSVLGTDAVMNAQLTLPNGMHWVSCADAIKQSNWQRVIIPTCSANTLAKLALGIRDTTVCELAGRAIAAGLPVELAADYLGFTPQTPLGYRQLYAGYVEQLRQYGVIIKEQQSILTVLEQSLKTETVNLYEAIMSQYQPVQKVCAPHGCAEVNDYIRAAVICWEGKLLTEQDAVNLPEESVIKVAKKAIISPLAKDKLRQRNIEIVREMEV